MNEAATNLPVITPQKLTATIKRIVAHWLRTGQAKDCYSIGSGQCYEFGQEVLQALGLDPLNDVNPTANGDIQEVRTEDFEKDTFYTDLRALRRAGEIVPADIPPRELARLIGGATHSWLKFQGRYYDAETPQGVERFLDMPFFKRQIDGLRAELAAKKKSAQ